MAGRDGPALVVTGATSGIGRAIAALHLSRGWRVFGSARTDRDAARLAAELGEGFEPLVLDVTDEGSLARAADAVREALGGRRLAGLVCNAGIGVPAPLELQPMAEWRRQIDVNLVGAAATAQAFLPLLGSDPALAGPPGRIVTMSSLGGKLGQPFVTAYCASKFGLEGFSEALRREVAPFGIGVTIMAPSAVTTPVWDKVAAQDLSRFDDTRYGRAFRAMVEGVVATGRSRALSPERVALATHAALVARRPKRRVFPSAFPLVEKALLPLAPKALVDALVRLRLRAAGIR